MIKLTLTEVGQPKDVQTKFGLKQKSYVKAKEYEGKFLNYWLSESTKSWAVGQVIEVENVESRDYTAQDGTLKTSWDIKLPRSGFAEILKRIEALENAQTKTSMRITNLENNQPLNKAISEDNYPPFEGQPDFDISPNDIMKQRDEDNPPF